MHVHPHCILFLFDSISCHHKRERLSETSYLASSLLVSTCLYLTHITFREQPHSTIPHPVGRHSATELNLTSCMTRVEGSSRHGKLHGAFPTSILPSPEPPLLALENADYPSLVWTLNAGRTVVIVYVLETSRPSLRTVA